MMKRVYLAVTLVLLAYVLPACALSDAEYRSMMKDSDFARADRELNSTWKRVNKVLSGSALETLKAEQREWVRKGRDDEAGSFMDEGFSRVEAYTKSQRYRG